MEQGAAKAKRVCGLSSRAKCSVVKQDTTHMLEFQQFNMIWDKKMGEYEAHAEELGMAMNLLFNLLYNVG